MKNKIKTILALLAAFCGLQLFAATTPIVTVDGTSVTVVNTATDAGNYSWASTTTGTLCIPPGHLRLSTGTSVKLTSLTFRDAGTNGGNTSADKIAITVGETAYEASKTTSGSNDIYSFGDAGPTILVGTTYNLTFTLPSGKTGIRYKAALNGSGSDGFFKVGSTTTYAPWLTLAGTITGESTSVYVTTISTDAWWSDLVFTKGGQTASWVSGSDVKVTVTGTPTLQSNNSIGNLHLFGSGDSDVLNFSSANGTTITKAHLGIPLCVKSGNFNIGGFTLAERGQLVFDASAGSYTIGNDTTKTMIRDTADKIFFKGSGNNGVTLDYSSNNMSDNKTVQSHLVFDGGTHVFKWINGSSGPDFGANATEDNPTILVKSETTLNFTGKDLTGWTGSQNISGIMKVENGGTLQFNDNGSGTLFYRQRLSLMPGGTIKVNTASDRFRLYGGTDESKAQIYMPSSSAGSAEAKIEPVGSNGVIMMSNDGTKGFAISVGANSTLALTCPFKTSDTCDVKKYGAGTVKLGDLSNYANNATFTAAAGTTVLKAGATYNANATYAVNSGATLAFSDATATTIPKLTLNSGAILKPSAAVTVSGTFTGSGYIIDAANLTPSEGAMVLTIPSGGSFGTFSLRNAGTGWALKTDGTALKFTQIPSASLDVSALSAGQGFGFSGDVTLNFDQAPSWDGKVSIGTSGKLTLAGYMDVTPAMLAKFDLGYNTIEYAWHTRKVISINFGSGMTADASDGSLAGYVKAKSWVNDSTSCTATDRPINKIWNGTAEGSLTGVTASWSGGGSVYGGGGSYSAQFQKAYIDDKSGSDTTLTVSGLPFSQYDVIIYYSADSTSDPIWKAPKVNESYYKAGKDGITVSATAQTDKWGAGSSVETKPRYGYNAIRVSGLSGTLSINTGNRDNGRSALAAIQIIDCSNVAQVGETQYPTLAAAVDAVEASGTVTLLADCAGTVYTDKTFTLDLNGHALAAEMTIGGTVTLAGDETGSAMTGTIRGTGTLVITDGITVTANNGANGYAVYGTAVTINNGTLKLNNGNEDAKVYNATFTIGENGALTNYGWMTFDGTVTLASDYTKTVLDYNNAKIRGSGTIVKNGSGTITLGSIPQEGSNGHPITVNAGTLILPAGDYDTSKVPVTVKDGAAIKIKLTQQQQIDGYTANVTFETSGTVTFIKPDGTTEVAGTGEGGNVFKPELPTGLLKYGFAFNGNKDKEAEAAETLSFSSGNWYQDGMNAPEKALKFQSGQNWGGGFSNGGGDFTIVAVVMAPSTENTCIFGFGGGNTDGLVALRRATGNNIAVFTKGGSGGDLITVEVPDATTKYHTYAIRYNNTTKKLALSVDFGAFGNEVSFTSNSNGNFQFGGINGGAPTGAANANDGGIDEFRFYTARLSVECVKQAAAPFVPSYEATIPADATGTLNFSTLPWYPETTTVYANRSWKIINNASADVTTVNVDGDAAKTKVTVVSATKVLKFGSPSKLNASAYDFSQAQGGVGFGVTGGWTVPETLRNYIRDNQTKVVFYSDETSSGATLTYSNSGSGTMKSHIVFEGGTHAMTYCGLLNNATADNPTILVKNGTTLDFYGHDMGGWTGSANIDGIIAVATGGRLNLHNTNGTFYYHQRFTLYPGSDMYFAGDSEKIRFQGGCTEGKELLYVPDSETAGNPAVIHATNASKDKLCLWDDSTIGIGVYVGNNSALDIETAVKTQNSSDKTYEIKKWGAGTLTFKGSLADFKAQGTGNGKLSTMAGKSVIACGGTVPSTQWVASGATLELGGTTAMTLSGVIGGAGNVTKVDAGTVTLTAANSYSGTTTVQAGTLEITGDGKIGSGDYSVAEGATLDLGTHRPAGNLTTSAGTVCVTLTSEEQTKFDNLEQFEILNAATDASLGSLRVFDAGGKEHLNSFVVEGGKVKVQKVDEKTQPFNVTAVGEKNWTAAGWTDSSVEPKTVLSKDWDIEIAANLAVAQDTSAALTLDRGIQLGTFNVTNLGTLAIADTADYALTAKTIDDSQSTGATTLNFALGTANVTAGANTIITKGGDGTLTVGSGMKATLNAGVTMGTKNLDANGTLRYAGDLSAGIGAGDYMSSDSAARYEFENAKLTGQMQLNDKPTIVVRNGDVVNVDANSGSRTRVAWEIQEGGTVTYAETDTTWFGYGNYTFTQTGGTFTSYAKSTATSGNNCFMLGFSGSGSMTFNISGGMFAVPNTCISFYQTATIDLTGSAVMKAKGVYKANNKGTVNIGTGTTFEIGSRGWAADSTTLNLNGGTIKAFEDSTVANAITLGADSTFAADAGATLKIAGAVTGASNIAVSGEGSVVFMQSSGVTPTKVTSGTAYYGFGVDINEAGVFTVPSGYTASSIKLYNAAGQPVKITGHSETEVYYECKMSDFSAWWKYEFNTNLSNDGTDGTALTWDGGSKFPKSEAYLTNIVWKGEVATTNIGIRVPCRPYRDVSSWPTTATFVMYGKMPSENNTVLIGFGSQTHPKAEQGGTPEMRNTIFLAVGDASKGEVKLCQVQNFSASTELCTMSVANATTTDHLYAFVIKVVNNKTVINTYLDGQLLQPYTFDGVITLGKGFQLGSIHGGTEYSGYTAPTAASAISVIDFLRVYQEELNSAAMAKYAQEYPYESPNGVFERTLSGTDGTWIQEGQWLSNDVEYVSQPLAGGVVQINATADTGLAVNLPADVTYESIAFGGNGKITLTNDTEKTAGIVKVQGRIGINTDTVLANDAFETIGSAISISDGKKLTLDCANVDVGTFWASTNIDLTGAVICGDYKTQVELKMPNVKAPRTATKRMDTQSLHIWVDITVPTDDIIGTVAADDTVTWSWANTAIEEADIDFDQTEVAIKIVMESGINLTLNEKYAKADLITVNGGNLNIGTYRDMLVAGKGTVDVQLTEAESSSTDELTLFNATGTADLAFRNVTDHAGQPKTDFIGGNGKIIVNPPATTLTGLHIARIMPKATSRTEDRDPNGRDSGWIDLINYGPTETNLANYQIIRTNLGKEYKTKVGKLLSRTVAKGQIYRIYTSEEYETAEYYKGDGKSVKAYAMNGEGKVVEDPNGLIIVPTKVNPKKYPMVRLVNGSEIIDEVIVPNDLDDNMQIEVVANADKLERNVVYTNGTKVAYGPAVDAIYGIDGVKTDLKLLNKAGFATVGADYKVVFPVNPFRTGTAEVLDANTITNVVLEYRVFDSVEANMPVKAVSNLVMTTATSEKEIANYGAGCQLWTGKIPAEAMVAGKLVQFRAKIFDKGGNVWTAPRNLNPDVGHIWYGVVAHPEIADTPTKDGTAVCTTGLQTFLMFVSGDNITEMDKDIGPGAGSQDRAKVPYGARCAIYDVENKTYYDNVRIDLRGQTSKTFTKKSHGLRFSKIAPLKCTDPFTGEEYELRKTSFIAEYGDPACIRQTLALRVMRASGVKAPFNYPVRIYRNGTYYQLAFNSSRFTDEAVEDIYGLNKYGYAYKNVHQLTTDGGGKANGCEKKTPDDDNENGTGAYDVLNEYVNRFQNESDNDKLTADAKKHFNLPAWINYMAATKITQECDDVWTNLGIYIDKYEYFLNKNGDDTIRPLAYDQNLSFGVWYYGDDSGRGRCGLVATNDLMKSHPFYGGKVVRYHTAGQTAGDASTFGYNRGMEVILQNETYRNAMVRRLRSLMEQFYGSNDADQENTPIWQWATKYWDAIAADVPVDHSCWQYNQKHMESNVSAIWVWTNAMDLAEAKTDLWDNFIVPHRNHLFVTHAASSIGTEKTHFTEIGYATTKSAGIPEEQSATDTLASGISITKSDGTKIIAGETTVTDGIVAIENTNAEAIDMSYWKIDGVATHVFAPGTVLPAGAVGNPGKLWIVLDRRAAATQSAIDGANTPMIVNVDRNADETISGEAKVNLVDAEGTTVATCQFYMTVGTDPESGKVVAVVTYSDPGESQTTLPMDWMVEHGIDTKGDEFQLSTNMNVKVEGGNNITPWESYALGLAPEDPESKPVIAPVQTSDAENITFKLTNVDGAGADTKNFTVTYKVKAGTTPGGSDVGESEAVGYGQQQSMELPPSGVRYYTLEVITTPKAK